MPIYNSAQYLRECIDSIVKQTFKNIEIILIDDGSTDDSGKICDEYAAADSRVIVAHNTNHGVSHARNCGIKLATGMYIAFIDSDDYIEYNYVESMLEPVFKQQRLYDLLVCRHYAVDAQGNKREVRLLDASLSGKLKDDYWSIQLFVGGPWIKFYKRELLVEHKLSFDENKCYSEDRVFNSIFYNFVNSYAFVDRAMYNLVNRNPNSLSKAVTANAFQDAVYEWRFTNRFFKDNQYKNYQNIQLDKAYDVFHHFSKFRKTEYGYRYFVKTYRPIAEELEPPVSGFHFQKRKFYYLLKLGLYWTAIHWI